MHNRPKTPPRSWPKKPPRRQRQVSRFFYYILPSCASANKFPNFETLYNVSQKAEYKAASGATTAVVDAASGEDISAGKYGDFPLIQSQNKHEDRHFVDAIGGLQAHVDQTVWLRGRVHTSRSKGKQCFLVLRKQSSTVQCVIIVDELRSKQMVKFCGKYVYIYFIQRH